jgi:cation:H+ antiporter
MLEFIPYMKLVGGLAYLLLGGDLLVRGAIGLANRTGISPMVAGLTIVAAGTSAPELMVSGFPEIALGNIIGSNIANVLLVLGVPALIVPIACTEPGIRSQALFMLAVTGLFVILCLLGTLTRVHGLMLLGILVGGTLMALRGQFSMPGVDAEDTEAQLSMVLGIPDKGWEIALLSGLGIVMLPLGADLTVAGSVDIARGLGVSEAVIGASLVAFGTSLPELSTTLVAAFHRNLAVVLGNVIGSNVLNILAIAGITATITIVPVEAGFLELDIWVMLAAALILTGLAAFGLTLSRLSGAVLLLGYLLYIRAIF